MELLLFILWRKEKRRRREAEALLPPKPAEPEMSVGESLLRAFAPVAVLLVVVAVLAAQVPS